MKLLKQIEKRLAEIDELTRPTLETEIWTPIPGSPQESAFFCDAQELLFGGQAGGGKGLACHSIQWAIENIESFTAECYDNYKHLIPDAVRDMDMNILMWNGVWKSNSEIAVGDRIMNPDGQAQEVLAVYERGIQDFYRVSFEDATFVECDATHLWGFWESRQNSRTKSCPGVKPILDTATPLNWSINYITRARVRDTQWLFNAIEKGRRFIIPIAAPLNFTHLTRGNAERAYLYGALLGDGCISKRITLYCGKGKMHVLERCESLCEKSSRYYQDGENYAINLMDKWVADWARNTGLMGCRSHEKFLPEGYLRESLSFRWNLARGLFDTDGYAADDKNEVSYCSVSFQLAEGVANLVRSLGFLAKVVEKQGYCHTSGYEGEKRLAYIVQVQGNDKWRLFSLPRKLDRARETESMHWVGKRIVSIEKIAPTYSRCIAVSNPNSLYITDGYNVTHNSDLLIGLAMREHKRSLILRKHSTDLSSMQARVRELTGIIGSVSFKLSNDRFIEFGGCKDDSSKFKYKGQAHDLKCVGIDTPVLMASGDFKPVQDVAIGDMVQTIEGPRRVTKTFVFSKRSILVSVCKDGSIIGSQVQSFDHQLLMSGLGACLLPLPIVFESSFRWQYLHPYLGTFRYSMAQAFSSDPLSVYPIGNSLLFDITVDDANHYITKVGDYAIVNKNCFDELSEWKEEDYEYICAWNRTPDPNQRCRIVATSNPPDTIDGRWIIRRWAPWLDSRHPNPAKSGEIRWFIRGQEVDGSEPVNGEYPRSRCFIRSSVHDNPYMIESGYDRLLDNLPDGIRERLRDGDFSVHMDDLPYQLYPSGWVKEAQQRWLERQYDPKPEPIAIGCDPARGGQDRTVVAIRYGDFVEYYSHPGKATPDGASVVQCILSYWKSGVSINVDAIGIGCSVIDYLRDFKHPVVAVSFSKRSPKTDRTGLLHFANLRTEVFWNLRDLLDPKYSPTLAIPDGDAVFQELTSFHYRLKHGAVVQVASTDEIKERTKRSPDIAVAIALACYGSRSYVSSF